MGNLQIRLFGRVQISHDNWKSEVNITRVIQGLLAYLLLQRHRTHTRDGLASLFWGEHNQEKARGCLNTTLWRLRAVLEPDGIPPGTYLRSNHFGEVGFNPESRYWLDVDIFENQINKVLSTPLQVVKKTEIEKLRKVIQLYRGDLLEGFYDDWALRERERVRFLYLNSLAYLMRYEKSNGLYENSLIYGRQILELDPLREEIHREMMRLYMQNQQRTLAVRQYKTCREILKAELDIEPMAETQILYNQIMVPKKPQPASQMKAEQNGLKEILNDLKLAAHSVEEMHGHLARVIGSIEGLFKDH
jgi:DNA-binding SARP family transcriptional activator